MLSNCGLFSVELLPVGEGVLSETPDGQVLARPGQVYTIRLSNRSDRRALVDVLIDGTDVFPGGLVLRAGSTLDLERPRDDRGRFTVIREGDERVFGADGGRENASLGLVEVRFRKERVWTMPAVPAILPSPTPPWPNVWWGTHPPQCGGVLDSSSTVYGNSAPSYATSNLSNRVRGAVGTGLTGDSKQAFRTVAAFPTELVPSVVRLRLVEGDADPASPRPLPRRSDAVPPRPPARP